MSARVLLWSLLLIPSVLSAASVAIIIDDLGNNLTLDGRALALPGALTYAVLPQLAYSGEVARRAHASGREVMLHMPMQPTNRRPTGPGGLHEDMSRAEFSRQVRLSLATVPHVSGVNNHMGSLLTRHPRAMEWLMAELRCYDRLYFVDSRTDARTLARGYARDAGLANAQRDVFLDNLQDTDYIRAQFWELILRARDQGAAIGIAHPYPQTLQVLAEEIPRLAEYGVELVPVSRLVETERNDRLWYASSSRLPTVAKN